MYMIDFSLKVMINPLSMQFILRISSMSLNGFFVPVDWLTPNILLKKLASFFSCRMFLS